MTCGNVVSLDLNHGISQSTRCALDAEGGYHHLVESEGIGLHGDTYLPSAVETYSQGIHAYACEQQFGIPGGCFDGKPSVEVGHHSGFIGVVLHSCTDHGKALFVENLPLDGEAALCPKAENAQGTKHDCRQKPANCGFHKRMLF